MTEYIRSSIEFCTVTSTNTEFLLGSMIDDTQGLQHKPVGFTTLKMNEGRQALSRAEK